MSESAVQPMLYQALGVVTGKLQYSPELHCSIVLEDGRSLWISHIKWCVKSWLSKHPEALEQSRSWGIYPRTDRNGILSSAAVHAYRPEIAPCSFKLVGDIVYQEPGKVTVRICRNIPPPAGKEQHLAWKPFFLTVVGDLAGANPRELWQIQGELEGEQIRITSGEKLKDPPSSQVRSNHKKRSAPVKRTRQDALPTDAVVSQSAELTQCLERSEPIEFEREPRDQPAPLLSQPILEGMAPIGLIDQLPLIEPISEHDNLFKKVSATSPQPQG